MTTNESQLEVIIDDKLSIADLSRLQVEGFSVLRSAHVGNFSPYNLTIAAAGIPVLCVDHNITGVDTNYMPESINTQAEVAVVAPQGRVSCRTKSDDLPGQPSVYLDELQTSAVRQAFPAADVYTNTAYLRANESVVREIVDIALDELPETFNRLVLPDATTFKTTKAAELVTRYGIMQLNDDPRQESEAVLMPNIIDILANFVVEAMRTEQAAQYHLSGPAMVKYIGDLMPDLNKLLAEIKQRASFAKAIPPRIEVRLVPTAQARFATTTERGEKLSKLLQTLKQADQELTQLNARRKDFFTSDDAGDKAIRQSFLQSTKQQESAVEAELTEPLAAMPELFIDPGEPGFITQYDVLNEGGLFVAPENTEMTMAELASLSKKISQLRRKLLL